MKALPLSEKFAVSTPGMVVYLRTPSGDLRRCTIHSFRKTGIHFIISCNEITDRQAALSLRGAIVAVPTASLPSADGEFLYEEIIGLSAITTTGREVGRVIAIMQTKAHDIYVVSRDEKEYLVPAVKEFVVKVLLDEKMIIVREMEGLFD